MQFCSPEKRIWLVTDAYAIVVSLQAPIYFRFLALIFVVLGCHEP